mmetsp:Transcript_23529/g.56254  ORF Transcript_23529/g.56254 Transcript_23529/m.56254 type:complete len:211 (+) Transcript_23529:155-787(+)
MRCQGPRGSPEAGGRPSGCASGKGAGRSRPPPWIHIGGSGEPSPSALGQMLPWILRCIPMIRREETLRLTLPRRQRRQRLQPDDGPTGMATDRGGLPLPQGNGVRAGADLLAGSKPPLPLAACTVDTSPSRPPCQGAAALHGLPPGRTAPAHQAARVALLPGCCSRIRKQPSTRMRRAQRMKDPDRGASHQEPLQPPEHSSLARFQVSHC